MEPRVQILMSTYNGEKYLKEQIETIFNQKDVDIDLLVRDDGSKDKTTQILENYSNEGKLKWYTGENLRPAKSFMNLIYNSGDFSYYAFSDQDDYWLPDKITSAIEKIKEVEKNEKSNTPVIYFSEKKIVDSERNALPHKITNYNVDFESAMIRNIATGCTIVMNKALMQKIKEYKPEYVVMHDSYVYRICLALDGKAIYDSKPHIEYRQHGDNVIGANEGTFKRIKRRINSFFECDHSRKYTAKEILKGYRKDLTEDKVKLLEEMANCNKFLNRMKLILNKKLKTESLENNFVFKVAVLIGKI